MFVTVRLTGPAACAGVVAVMVVLLTTVTPVAAVLPRVTVAPATKLVPVIVIAVPPVVRPVFGNTLLTVGAVKLYVNAFDSAPLCPPGLVTVTFTVPAEPAGVVAVIVVLLTTVTPVAALPPRLTVAPATKLVPVIVMAVPPVVEPDAGVTLVTVGAGKTYVKPAVSVPLWLSGLVTVTLAAPAACAGVVAVMVVLFTTVTPVAALPLRLTVAPATKLVPVIVIGVPPVVRPVFGNTLLTVGAVKLYVNAFDSAPLCPPGLVTVTFTVPAEPAGVVAVIVVLLTTVTPVAALPPRLTVAPATKLVPVIVMAVPPVVEPDTGVTLATVGGGKAYMKAFDSVPLCPPGFVTVKLAVPAVPAGVEAVMVVLFTTVILVAAVLPRVTVAPATKLVPVIVMAVPPEVGPVSGVTLVTVGKFWAPEPETNRLRTFAVVRWTRGSTKLYPCP